MFYEKSILKDFAKFLGNACDGALYLVKLEQLCQIRILHQKADENKFC